MDNPAKPPKLLDRMHGALRVRHYSYRAEWTYLDRARRLILFHCKRQEQHGRGQGRVTPDARPRKNLTRTLSRRS